MSLRREMLAFGCRADDLALLTETVGPMEPALRVTDDPREFARRALADRPFAVVLGVGRGTLSNLDMLPVIRAVRRELRRPKEIHVGVQNTGSAASQVHHSQLIAIPGVQECNGTGTRHGGRRVGARAGGELHRR